MFFPSQEFFATGGCRICDIRSSELLAVRENEVRRIGLWILQDTQIFEMATDLQQFLIWQSESEFLARFLHNIQKKLSHDLMHTYEESFRL